MKLTTKLLLAFVSIGILSVFITALLSYQSAKNALQEASFKALTAVRETKKRQIDTYFSQIRNQVLTLSRNQVVIKAMKEFKTSFHSIKNDLEFTDNQFSELEADLRNYYKNEFLPRLNNKPNGPQKGIDQFWPDENKTITLQYFYIANNPYSIGSKDNLNSAGVGSEYNRIHSTYHPFFKNYLKMFGYYDVFLVDAKTGHIVYTVLKETDFATNILTGPYKNTNFSRAFKETLDHPDKDFVKLVDFEPYAPSYSIPASFIGSPIFDGDEKIGVLLFQIPIDEINRVMTGNKNWKNEGLESTGETYIVGADYKMRNDSRFLIEEPERYFKLLKKIRTNKNILNDIKTYSTSILFQEVGTEASVDALKGNTGTKIIQDYRGIQVLSSYTPLKIPDLNWAILSEIDTQEAFSPVNTLKHKAILVAIVITGFVSIIGFLTSKTILNPILLLTKGTKKLGKGDLSMRVKVTSKDEIGALAYSFNKMADNLQKSTSNLKNVNENLKKEIVERKQAEALVRHRTLQLERTNKELGEFTYIASHDLQEPLRTMSSYCSLLKEDAEETLSDDATEDIGFIIDAAKRMQKLIQDLLQLSRVGRIDLKMKTVDLNKCLDRVLHDLESCVRKSGGKIEWNGLPTVRGDFCHLARVFQNLIDNALKFNKNKAPYVKISARMVGAMWEITVADNGIGMEPKYLEKAFAPFQRLNSAKSFNGSGVGLSICRKIIQRHGGEIVAESVPGKGSKFKFTLKA